MQELFDSLPQSWKELLESEKHHFLKVQKFLNGREFIPSQENIFRALSINPSNIRVLILGQDPYPNPAHAMGLSFSVPASVTALPASLRNIFNELESDLGVVNTSGDLSTWSEQGVLLLNRILTTDPTSSLAHAGNGWEEITKRIVEIAVEQNAIAVLWGNKAQELAHHFPEGSVLASAHPSPLSSYRGFFGSKPFSKVNALLMERGEDPIDWRTR